MPLGKEIADWSFGGQPEGTDLENRRDRIRIMVGDTDEDLKLIDDSTIEWRISLSGDDKVVAALVAEDISARFLKYATTKSAKDYSESYANVAKAYAEKAKELWRASPTAIPSAPQLRFSTRKPFRQDPDLKQPQFSVGMLSEDTIPIEPGVHNDVGDDSLFSGSE